MRVSPHHHRRQGFSLAMLGLCWLAAGLAVAALAAILGYVTLRGAGALDLDFFTRLPHPVGEPGGGMANAILGSLVLLALAMTFGLPVGLLAGTYLSEYGNNRFASVVRYLADVSTGIPSIIMGIFVYTLLVATTGGFSALAGGVALGLIMIPILVRTTEEMLRTVPVSLREASLALGVPRWRTILLVVLPAARVGVLTGVLLAGARIAGETAPLLFTALSSRYWPTGLTEPIPSLPIYIFTYAISPYPHWHQQAWAGALVLLLLVLLFSTAARLLARHRG